MRLLLVLVGILVTCQAAAQLQESEAILAEDVETTADLHRLLLDADIGLAWQSPLPWRPVSATTGHDYALIHTGEEVELGKDPLVLVAMQATDLWNFAECLTQYRQAPHIRAAGLQMLIHPWREQFNQLVDVTINNKSIGHLATASIPIYYEVALPASLLASWFVAQVTQEWFQGLCPGTIVSVQRQRLQPDTWLRQLAFSQPSALIKQWQLSPRYLQELRDAQSSPINEFGFNTSWSLAPWYRLDLYLWGGKGANLGILLFLVTALLSGGFLCLVLVRRHLADQKS